MTKNSVCHAPYLRNHTLHDFRLWYTSVKGWYLQVFFFCCCCFFHFFKVLIFQVFIWVKGQKKLAPKEKKFCLLRSMSQEACIVWLWYLVHTCKMMTSLDAFFIFSKFLFFRFLIVRGVKGQKMAQSDQKFCLCHPVSQEPCLIWLWFLVNKCEMMISPAIFFSFLKSWFFGFSVGEGVKGQKIIHNYQFQSVTLFMSRTIDHIIKILVHRCKIMISRGVFLYF